MKLNYQFDRENIMLNSIDGKYDVGPESSEVRLFSEEEIPWADIAFTVIEKTIKFYYQDVKKGNIDIHFDTIIKTR